MIHPDTVIRYVNDAVGVGVFATRRIPRGTITWVRDPFDTVLSDAQVRSLLPQPRRIIDRYAWREAEGWILCWDHARYVNHHCEANCMGLGVQFEIALRDIEEGEELTDDYRSLGLFEDAFDCLCGGASCRGHVAPTDTEVLRPRWMERFQTALLEAHRYDQPLLPWVRPEDLALLPAPPVAETLRRRA